MGTKSVPGRIKSRYPGRIRRSYRGENAKTSSAFSGTTVRSLVILGYIRDFDRYFTASGCILVISRGISLLRGGLSCAILGLYILKKSANYCAG